MGDYISREEAIALAKDIIVSIKDSCDYRHRCIDPQDIAELPAADVVEREKYDRLLENAIIVSASLQEYQKADAVQVVRGKWIWDDEGYHCSECWHHAYGNGLEIITGEYHYCPNCGAHMDGERE